MVVATDSRLSEGYKVIARNISKIATLGPQVFLASSGMWADFEALKKTLSIRLSMYEYDMAVRPSVETVASLVSRTLYSRRFFPYYTFNIVAGLDSNGNGAVYGYDAIGSYERGTYMVQGSGKEYLSPFLDAQIREYNLLAKNPPKTVSQAEEILIDGFIAITERDIYTGKTVREIVRNEIVEGSRRPS